MIAQQSPKSRSVQNRAAANDSLAWKSGESEGYFRHNVCRIGRNQQSCVRRRGNNLRNNAFKNFHIAAQQVYSGLSGFLISPGRNNNDLCAFQIFISSALNLIGISKRSSVGNIHGLRHCPLFISVNQNNFTGHTAHNQSKSGCASYRTGPDNSNFHIFSPHILFGVNIGIFYKKTTKKHRRKAIFYSNYISECNNNSPARFQTASTPNSRL